MNGLWIILEGKTILCRRRLTPKNREKKGTSAVQYEILLDLYGDLIQRRLVAFSSMCSYLEYSVALCMYGPQELGQENTYGRKADSKLIYMIRLIPPSPPALAVCWNIFVSKKEEYLTLRIVHITTRRQSP
jgi:hypothetical protein